MKCSKTKKMKSICINGRSYLVSPFMYRQIVSLLGEYVNAPSLHYQCLIESFADMARSRALSLNADFKLWQV